MKIKFMDAEHKRFFLQQVTRTNAADDPYRKALFYALGLTDETRRHVKDLYDFEDRGISVEGLHEAWQTGTSARVTRLAFNLYNGACGQWDENEYAESYTPYGLFDCGLIDYMLEAVRVRFADDARLE